MACEILTTMMSFAIACFQRFVPLLKTLWMNIDIGLDFRQAVVYREHAFEENGTYHLWAIDNTDPSNNYTQTGSHAYFQTSCVIFFLPPLIITLVLIVVGIIDERDAFDDDSLKRNTSFLYRKIFSVSMFLKFSTLRSKHELIMNNIFIFCTIKIYVRKYELLSDESPNLVYFLMNNMLQK